MDVAQIIAAAISFIIGVVAVLPTVVKLKKLLLEVQEFLAAVSSALEDNRLTKDELRVILKEAKDIPLAMRKLKGTIVKRAP